MNEDAQNEIYRIAGNINLVGKDKKDPHKEARHQSFDRLDILLASELCKILRGRVYENLCVPSTSFVNTQPFDKTDFTTSTDCFTIRSLSEHK